MKAIRLVEYDQLPKLVEVEKPNITSPSDVVVKIAAAGVCKTDLHVIDGVFKDLGSPKLPFTLGHENVGWIEEIGADVKSVQRGDSVVLYPQVTCGVCAACKEGRDMFCASGRFPGLDGADGGYAEYMKTSVRSVIKLPPGTDPVKYAPLTDAGITVYHAIKRISNLAKTGSSVALIGVGGLGHIAVQLLKMMTKSKLIAIDVSEERTKLASELGADHSILLARDVGGSALVREEVMNRTGGIGADIVLDLVGEDPTTRLALEIVRKGGTYSVVGYGGNLSLPTFQLVGSELTILGNLVGNYNELAELVMLAHGDRIKLIMKDYKLSAASSALEDLRRGKILGRGVLIP